MDAEVWAPERLPRTTVAAVRGAVARVVDRIIAAIAAENPVYAEVLSDPAGMGIRLGIEQALHAFLDAVEQGQPPAALTDEVWQRLGEAEFQAGRSLEALRDAFRTGTRAAWRAAADIATELNVDTASVIALAEGIFVYSDALAADVTEGYRRIQSDEAGERERRRRRLSALLLERDHDPEAVERMAELARWPLPRELAILAVGAESAAPLGRQLDVDVLLGAGIDGAWLVLPDPNGPGRSERLRSVVAQENVSVSVGPVVAPAAAQDSLRWARRTLDLIQRGLLVDERPTYVTDHLSDVILLQDEGLAQRLIAERLAPIRDLGAGERQRLLETLQAWLSHQRQTPAVAAQLHVHPQTVRYRMGKLRELLGDALEDPEQRFDLEAAVRAWRRFESLAPGADG